MPRKPTPRPTDDVRIGGIFDTIADAAEAVVSVVYPAAAPIAAAEHKLRTGSDLNAKEAKAATTAATQLGKAVAQNVQDQVAAGTGPAVESVESDHDVIRDHPPRDPAPAATYELTANRKPSGSSSSNGLLLVGGIALLLLLAGDL